MDIYKFITLNKQKGKKLFAVLIDPDKQSTNELLQLIGKAVVAKVDLIFVGGSLLTNGNFFNMYYHNQVQLFNSSSYFSR